MAEENGKTEEQNKSESSAGDKFTPITSQEELTRVIGGRINAVKSQYSDYDDLKAKAAKFDEAEQANLSELEKERKARESVEAELNALKAEKQQRTWAEEIAKDSDVPVEALRGTTKEELEAHFKVLSSLVTKPPKTRTATPPGRPAGDGEKGRAAAALRELRQG